MCKNPVLPSMNFYICIYQPSRSKCRPFIAFQKFLSGPLPAITF